MAVAEPQGAPAHAGHPIPSGLRHIPVPAWALLTSKGCDPHAPCKCCNKDPVESKVVPPWPPPGGQPKWSLDHQSAQGRTHSIVTDLLRSKLNT